MESFAAHFGILPEAQLRLWPELRPAADLGFVLYGGTAIALRLGHRTSIDFDFFTERQLRRSMLEDMFPFLRTAQVVQESSDTFTALAFPYATDERPVKLSFFGSITFGRVAEPQWTDDGVAQVASFEDLLATKVKVLLQRVEAKDYLDIAALLHSGLPLERGLAAARALFGLAFQPSECLKALVYFKGGDLDTLAETTRNELICAVSVVRDLPHIPVIDKQLTLR
ncbi:MAG TPA: nucleotidyl transferase AbiEii/AbiGii toxin family protein [Acidobacteriaceae bacterium]|nr:nucleotidyl transferase AbiEii/AbiGii toxin family protein [Acidobacteriaceae bacterium]